MKNELERKESYNSDSDNKEYTEKIENKEPQKIMLAENIDNVGQLIDALNQMPADTKISPFGSGQSKLVYIPNDNIAYLDEDLSFLEEDEEYDYHYEDEQCRGR